LSRNRIIKQVCFKGENGKGFFRESCNLWFCSLIFIRMIIFCESSHRYGRLWLLSGVDETGDKEIKKTEHFRKVKAHFEDLAKKIIDVLRKKLI
jgi:hypothetical protein